MWQTTFAGKGYVSYLTNCTQKCQTSMHLNSSLDSKRKFSCTSFWAFAHVAFPSFIWHIKWSLNNCILSLIHAMAQRDQYWSVGKCIFSWLYRIYFYIRVGFLCWFVFFFCLFLGAWGVCAGPLGRVPCRGAVIKNQRRCSIYVE